MSADAWSFCPRCTKRDQDSAEALAKKLRAKADAAYGSVTASEWRQLDREALEAQESIHLEPKKETMREDWEIGVPEGSADGDLFISYRAACSECGLRYEFKHEDTIT